MCIRDSAYLSLDTATLSQKADQERVTASPILRAEEAMPWEYDQSFGDKVKSGASKTYRDLVSDQAEGEKLARIQEKKRKMCIRDRNMGERAHLSAGVPELPISCI